MTTALLVALMVVLFSFQSLFTRLYSRAYAGPDADHSTAVFSVCYGLFIALCSLASNGLNFHPTGYTWLFAAINALVLLLYNTSMIRGGNLGSYAFLMLSSLFGGIVLPLIVGVAFLGEKMSALQWTAVAVMFAAIVLMNSKGLNLSKTSRGYYLWCALLFFANGMYGVIMNLQVNKLNGSESSEMLVILFALSALFAFILEAAGGRESELIRGFRMGKTAALWLLLCCASAFAAARLMLYLLSQMQSGLLYTIDNGGVLALSFLYSIFLFKEKPSRLQLLGMLLAAASVIMLNL
ncbi:MAG: hypothetical protein IJM56_07235 [Clostridia bacterium]|nr:hypothetical protein [Clostridia bacterium]